MVIGIQYQIDKGVYDRLDTPHNVIMVTSEYSDGTKTLVHLQIGRNFHIRLNNMLRYRLKADVALDNEQFFSESPHKKGKIKAITHSIFEEQMSQFDMSKATIEREIVEEYHYTDKSNRPQVIQIPITIKSDSTFAEMEFENIEQYDNFIAPAWLICRVGR